MHQIEWIAYTTGRAMMLRTSLRIAFYSGVFDALLECGFRRMEKR